MADRRDPDQDDRRAEASSVRHITDKVACPSCGCLQSTVQPLRQTREQQQTGGYWRRRVCSGCGTPFDTEEIVRTDARSA